MTTSQTSSGNSLFATGAQVSILTRRMAFELGLDTNNDGRLDSQDASYTRQETISGISGSISAPVFLIDEVHVPTERGPDLVWTDLQWLVLDIDPGIDAVFGFDNMTSGWIETAAVDGKSGYIMQSYLVAIGGALNETAVPFDTSPVALFDFTISVDNSVAAGDYAVDFSQGVLLSLDRDLAASFGPPAVIREEAVPEPAALSIVGLLALPWILRRRRLLGPAQKQLPKV